VVVPTVTGDQPQRAQRHEGAEEAPADFQLAPVPQTGISKALVKLVIEQTNRELDAYLARGVSREQASVSMLCSWFTRGLNVAIEYPSWAAEVLRATRGDNPALAGDARGIVEAVPLPAESTGDRA
jgi:hypothetical protein